MNPIEAAHLHAGMSGSSPDTQGHTPGSTGYFRGEALRTLDTKSVLADAAEELTMAHSERAEEKAFTERKVKAEQRLQVMTAEEVSAYLDNTHANDPEALARMAKRLLSGKESPRRLA